jgi:hypothetical protein
MKMQFKMEMKYKRKDMKEIPTNHTSSAMAPNRLYPSPNPPDASETPENPFCCAFS